MLRRHALYPTELRARRGGRSPMVGWGQGRDRGHAPSRRGRRPPLFATGAVGRARGISRVLSPRGGGSFIWDRRCRRPRAAYPGLGRGEPPLVPYLALLRVGFTVRPLLPAARCALTAPFHPCLCRTRRPSAVCSLWHFPSPRGARALPGTLPCGARTFLRKPGPPAILTRTLDLANPRPSAGIRSPQPVGV